MRHVLLRGASWLVRGTTLFGERVALRLEDPITGENIEALCPPDEFEPLAEPAPTLSRRSLTPFSHWRIDGRSTGGDPDLFKFFVERAHHVLKAGGRLGMLVPSALYNNEACTGLRHLLLDEMKEDRALLRIRESEKDFQHSLQLQIRMSRGREVRCA
jgi:hypothetical protein